MMKYPEAGRVKTRLARDIGNQRAAEISTQVAEMVLRNTIPPAEEYGRIIFIDPREREADFRAWLPEEEFVAQQGSDLGERMDNVIRFLLSSGAEKAVITGADIPKLSRYHIAQAFQKLDQADVVIGPAKDGGYYLIGMKAPALELFQGIPWSTEKVFSETVRALNRLAKSYHLLPVLSDIDTPEDLVSFFQLT